MVLISGKLCLRNYCQIHCWCFVISGRSCPCLKHVAMARFVTPARFCHHVKFDALPARFVAMWWQKRAERFTRSLYVLLPLRQQHCNLSFLFPRVVCGGGGGGRACVLLSPRRWVLNWNYVYCSSVSCVKIWPHVYRDWANVRVGHVLYICVLQIYLMEWLVWLDAAKTC